MSQISKICMALCLLCLMVVLSEASVSKGRYFQVSIQRTASNTPVYYIWVPDSIPQFKGVIAHHHACGGDGDAPTMYFDYTWHYLTEKHSCIFVAPMENEDCNTWAYASSGSFTTLKQAVDSVARWIGHPELLNVPYAIWGFSGGGDWVAFMTETYASQLAVAVPRSAWNNSDPSSNPNSYPSSAAAIRGVPMLWTWGGPQDHGGDCNDQAIYQHGRSVGYPWGCGVENNAYHTAITARIYAIPYFDAMLTLRLPQSGSVSVPLDTTTMWYGCSTGVSQFGIYPVSSFTGDRSKCALLPNQAFAQFWKRTMAVDFSAGNANLWQQMDTTPPEAPRNLRATAVGAARVNLEWDLLPDLESSIKDFRVYRNNVQVYDYCTAKGITEIQPTGGDDQVVTPDTPLVAFTDTNVTNGSSYSYQVTTINRANLESPRSAPLVVYFKPFAIVPSDSGVIPAGLPFHFVAQAFDQHGKPQTQQPAVTWSATGGTITQNGVFTPSANSGRIIAVTQGGTPTADTVPVSTIACTKGLSYDYFARLWLNTVYDIPAASATKSGTAANISLAPTPTTADSFALRFTGYIMIPVSGTYTFFISSDDGGVLSVDGRMVAGFDGPHGGQEVSGLISLGWGLHPFSVQYFQEAGGAVLGVNWQGPGIAKATIPDSMFYHGSGATNARPRDIADATRGPLSQLNELSLTKDYLKINQPDGSSWVVDLFALNGKHTLRMTGHGCASIPLANNRAIGNGFSIVRLQSSTGVTTSKWLNTGESPASF